MLQDHTEIYESMLECMSFKVNCLLEFKISCMEDKNGLILEEKKKKKEKSLGKPTLLLLIYLDLLCCKYLNAKCKCLKLKEQFLYVLWRQKV